MIRLGTFSYWANSYWGGAVAAIGGALVLGALPRIKYSQRLRDAVLMGLGFAVLANSRPYEGLFFSLPVAGALGVWMLGKNRPPLRLVARRVVAPLFLVLVLTGCAMGYYFWRTTGSPWDTPYLVYARTYHLGGAGWGGRVFPWQSLGSAPVYHHALFQDYYRDIMLQYERSRSMTSRLTGGLTVLIRMWDFYLGAALTLPLLVALATLPYGFSWRHIGSSTRFLTLVCLMLTGGSMLPIFFMPHYAAPIAGAILALVLLPMRRLRSQKGRDRSTGLFVVRAVPLICLLMLLLRVAAKPLRLPEPGRYLTEGPPLWCALTPSNPERAATLARLQELPGRQLAIVHYGPNHKLAFHEWVYNEADVDRAKVIWARDMGTARNKELIDYFRDRQAWLVEADETPPRVAPYSASL